jgi:hypothetical protein
MYVYMGQNKSKTKKEAWLELGSQANKQSKQGLRV